MISFEQEALEAFSPTRLKASNPAPPGYTRKRNPNGIMRISLSAISNAQLDSGGKSLLCPYKSYLVKDGICITRRVCELNT